MNSPIIFHLAHSVCEWVVLELWRVLDDCRGRDPGLEGVGRLRVASGFQQEGVAFHASEKRGIRKMYPLLFWFAHKRMQATRGILINAALVPFLLTPPLPPC